MKKLTIAILIGLMSASGWSACTYSLDVTQATLDANQPGSKVFPIRNNQKSSFLISPTNGQTPKYVAVDNNSFTQQSLALINPPINGLFAYEFKIKIPTYNLQSGEGLTFFPIMGTGVNGGNNTQGIVMSYLNDSTMNVFSLNNSNGRNGIIFSPQTTASGYQTLGIYVNQDSKQVGYILNGVNQGYVYNYSQIATGYKFGYIASLNGFNSSSPNIGKEISIELITDATKMTQTYPTGTKDICGNTI